MNTLSPGCRIRLVGGEMDGTEVFWWGGAKIRICIEIHNLGFHGPDYKDFEYLAPEKIRSIIYEVREDGTAVYEKEEIGYAESIALYALQKA